VVTGGAIQSGASALAMLLLMPMFETPTIRWTPSFIAALTYMIVGVSIGALTLLYIMIRRGDVSRVASVFYLVPVSAAAASFLILGERFDSTVITGVCIVAVGVLLANAKPAETRTSGPARPTKFRLSGDMMSSGLKWSQHATQGRRGALIHDIYDEGPPRGRMAIVRFTPGSSAAAHRHTGYEAIFILDGGYQDDFGEHKQDELVVYPPNSEHSWNSPDGATLLVVWDAPTEPVGVHSPMTRARSLSSLVKLSTRR
jgi:uncharacterized membrane protein/quercetin dioxygenase-like cupin family protein